MSFSELFDGEEHWLDVGCSPGWISPFLVPGEPVELEVQYPPLDELESPEINYAPSTDSVVEMTWNVERGWSSLAVCLQKIGELLTPGGENNLVAEQLVVRDEKTWKITSTHYRVFWKGPEEDVEGL